MLYFVRYACVGVLGTAIDAGLLYILVQFGHIPLLIGVAISFVVAATSNFIFNKFWTFRDSSKKRTAQYVTFLAVSVLGFSMTIGLITLFVDIFFLWYIWAKILTSCIVMIFNFSANSIITFKEKH